MDGVGRDKLRSVIHICVTYYNRLKLSEALHGILEPFFNHGVNINQLNIFVFNVLTWNSILLYLYNYINEL